MRVSSTVLGNSRRMLLVEFLKKNGGKAKLSDIVEYIMEKEHDTSKKHRKSVYVSLVQTHIPKLQREGIITFERGVLTLKYVPEDVTLYLEVVSRNDVSWSTFYAGTSLLFLVVGLYLRSFPLVISSVIYLIISLFHRKGMKKVNLG